MQVALPPSKILTVSRLHLRGSCARADHLRHDDLLAPAGIETEAEPLVRGSVIHAGLAAAFVRFPAEPDESQVTAAVIADATSRGLGARDARLPSWTRVALRAARAVDPQRWEPVRLQNAPAISSGEAGRPVRVTPVDDATARLQGGPVLVEERLGVPIPDGPPEWGALGRGWVFSFKPDVVIRNRDTGLVWLWDHKTKSSLARVEPWTELHLQALLYVRALRTLGVDVTGAVLYAVLADEPTVPRLRNDGHLGETSWKTDWPTAASVIRRSADPDPDSPRYAKLRDACARREWQLTQEVVFDDDELEIAWAHLVACRDELVRSRMQAERKALDSRLPIWRAVHPSGRGHACGSCDFRQWCAEDFGGRDPEVMIGSTYRRGADKYLAEVSLTTARECTDYVGPRDFHGIDTHRARP